MGKSRWGTTSKGSGRGFSAGGVGRLGTAKLLPNDVGNFERLNKELNDRMSADDTFFMSGVGADSFLRYHIDKSCI